MLRDPMRARGSRRRVVVMLSTLLLLGGASLLGTGGAALAAAPEKLQVAVEGAYPPFNAVDAKGNWSGFDVEVAQAVCKQMAISCKLVQQPWDKMISGLVAGQYDMVVSSMSITEPRKQKIDFTQPYYQTPAKFIARKGTVLDADLAALKGKRVGVQKATNHDQYLRVVHGDLDIVRYQTIGEATSDLAAGKVDVVFGDAMGLNLGFLKTPKGKDFAFVGPDMRDPRFFGQGMAIAVQKGNDGLRDRLNEALLAIKSAGTYSTIERKYFVFSMLP